MPLWVYCRFTMYHRHGLMTNMIAMVLVFTMPLCCCIVRTATGATDSCCSTNTQEEITSSCCQKVQKSCCENERSKEEQGNESCNGGCGCTFKGMIFVQNWSPPVDTFGVDTPAPFVIEFHILQASHNATTFAHGPPKFSPHHLGNSSAPPIRGSLILEV